MAAFASLGFFARLRLAVLLFVLVVALFIQRACQPAAPAELPSFTLVSAPALMVRDTSRSSAQPALGRKALPRSRWYLVPGPAYLVYPLPRRPKQAQLDAEAAKAAQLHKI